MANEQKEPTEAVASGSGKGRVWGEDLVESRIFSGASGCTERLKEGETHRIPSLQPHGDGGGEECGMPGQEKGEQTDG